MPDVDHVVMFDFPLNPIDYLHRSGERPKSKVLHTSREGECSERERERRRDG